MQFGIKAKGMDDIRRSIDRLPENIDPEELARWAKTCQTMARKLCNDKLSDIIL